MHSYGVSDVERLLRLSRGTIRGLIRRGFVAPTRGPRREYRFSFEDLIVLRTARSLSQAKLPRQRIHRALGELRRSLPAAVPLSGLSICAVGEQVVVREGASRYQAESGQYLLELEVQMSGGTLSIVERAPLPPPPDTDALFEEALRLESEDPSAACAAYERCIAADPECVDAHVNLGRLLHERGRLAEAERVYRRALENCEADATLLFNLAVLLEDVGRIAAAIETYQRSLTLSPEFADAHYNVARLYEQIGSPQHAIRHLGRYRRLTHPTPP